MLQTGAFFEYNLMILTTGGCGNCYLQLVARKAVLMYTNTKPQKLIKFGG